MKVCLDKRAERAIRYLNSKDATAVHEVLKRLETGSNLSVVPDVHLINKDTSTFIVRASRTLRIVFRIGDSGTYVVEDVFYKDALENFPKGGVNEEVR